MLLLIFMLLGPKLGPSLSMNINGLAKDWIQAKFLNVWIMGPPPFSGLQGLAIIVIYTLLQNIKCTSKKNLHCKKIFGTKRSVDK
jgi:hypothetical protein